MTPPIPRHRVLTEWEYHARDLEEAFREPIIIDHLEATAETAGAFASVFDNLRRDLAALPWLAEEAAYGWVLERGAYRFAAEAMNQSRVLHALGGLVDADDPARRRAAGGVAARQTLAWRIEAAEPQCRRVGDWRFVVVPFAWENATVLLLLALRAHAVASQAFRRLFALPPTIADWRAPAKGLLLSAIPLPEAREALVDSFLIERMRTAHPWFEDAVFSLAQFDDPVVRTLTSISTDWVVGHEVGHALLHAQTPWSPERERQADRAGLVQLLQWIRPRDLTGLAADISPNLWDYLSARIGLLMLTLANRIQTPAWGERSPLADLRARSLRADILGLVDRTTITSEEVRLIDEIEECFESFLIDLAALREEVPAWAQARARHAARSADQAVRAELAAHKAAGGGPIRPQPEDRCGGLPRTPSPS